MLWSQGCVSLVTYKLLRWNKIYPVNPCGEKREEGGMEEKTERKGIVSNNINNKK
jgi:hypothetical protein